MRLKKVTAKFAPLFVLKWPIYFSGLNLGGRSKDVSEQNYLSSAYTSMECDPSPSRHIHRQRFQSSMLNHGSSSLQYVPYPTTRMESTPPKHSHSQNGPQNKSDDQEDSPMVCVQQSPVAIHWALPISAFPGTRT